MSHHPAGCPPSFTLQAVSFALASGGSSHGAAPLAAAERAGQVHRGVRPGEAPLGGGAQELAAPCRGAAVWRAEEAEGGMSSTAPRSSQWHGP